MTTTTPAPTARQEAAQAGMPDRLAQLQRTTRRELADTEEAMRRVVAAMQRNLSNLVTDLDEGMHVESRGVVQTDGPKLDMLCQRREALLETLAGLDHVADEDR